MSGLEWVVVCYFCVYAVFILSIALVCNLVLCIILSCPVVCCQHVIQQKYALPESLEQVRMRHSSVTGHMIGVTRRVEWACQCHARVLASYLVVLGLQNVQRTR